MACSFTGGYDVIVTHAQRIPACGRMSAEEAAKEKLVLALTAHYSAKSPDVEQALSDSGTVNDVRAALNGSAGKSSTLWEVHEDLRHVELLDEPMPLDGVQPLMRALAGVMSVRQLFQLFSYGADLADKSERCKEMRDLLVGMGYDKASLTKSAYGCLD